MSATKRWGGLLLWIALSYSAAIIGSQFPAQPFYSELNRPAWAPPSWLFGPVWTVLYLLMGIATWLVWLRPHRLRSAALAAFLVQLVLNAAWSWIFFGLRETGIAFAEISVLWIAILITLMLFWKVRKSAGMLLVPYLVWVGYAAALNYSLWAMNRS